MRLSRGAVILSALVTLGVLMPPAGADGGSTAETSPTTVRLSPPYAKESTSYSGTCRWIDALGPDCKVQHEASAANGTLAASLELDTGARGAVPRQTLSEEALVRASPELVAAVDHSEEVRRIDVSVPFDVEPVVMQHMAAIGSSVAGAELWAWASHPGCGGYECRSEVTTLPLGDGDRGIHTLKITMRPPDGASLLPAGRLQVFGGISATAGLFAEHTPAAATPEVDPVRVPFSLPICYPYGLPSPWNAPRVCMEYLWQSSTFGGVASREVRRVQGFATSGVTAAVPTIEVTLEGVTTSPPGV